MVAVREQPVSADPENTTWKSLGQAAYVHGRSFIDGADALAFEMEKKWGAGRLRLLVDNDLRARFDSQRMKFNQAIRNGDLEDVKRETTRMQTAWRALDRQATEMGAERLSNEVWEVARPDGKVAALVRDRASAGHVRAEGRFVDVFTLDEIGQLMVNFPELLLKTRESFPGAEVVRVGPIRDPLDEFVGDEIPF